MRPALDDEAAAFAGGDGFGERRGFDRDEVGRAADLEAVVLEAEHARGGGGHHVEGQRQLRVVAEVGAVADQHGAFEHVAVAEGRPGIADIVGAAEHLDAVLAQQLQRRDGRAAGAVAHDGDAGAGQRVGGAA